MYKPFLAIIVLFVISILPCFYGCGSALLVIIDYGEGGEVAVPIYYLDLATIKKFNVL